MKRNKIMALTALLTLIGAPLSKAQEKGGSQQSTSAQSEKIANKDSKATEQVKNQGQSKDSKALQTKDSKALQTKDSKAVDKTKDSKAPQQTKDSKTAEKTKEETKKDSKDAQQTKEQPKDSKKGNKENKNSSSAYNEDFMNRMINLGYNLEWINNNWPWLVAMGGTGLVSGGIGNKMGKNANVDAKVQQIVGNNYMKKTDVANNYTKNDQVNTNYIKKTEVDNNYTKNDDKNGILAKAAVFGVKYTDDELKAKAQQLANGKKYDDADLANEEFLGAHNLMATTKVWDLITRGVSSTVDTKINSGELLEKSVVETNYMKKTDVETNYMKKTEVETNYMKKTEVDNNYTKNDKVNTNYIKKTDVETNYTKNIDIANQYIKKDNDDAIKQAAANLGIKYTDDDLKAKIDAAVSTAKSMGLLTRIVDENKKKPFDNYVGGIDKQLQCSLSNIQKVLEKSFQSIFAITKYDNDGVPDDKVVDALNMLADIKNALVDKQALDFKASIAHTENAEDYAWSDFYFDLGSKKYNVYVNHTENEDICIDVGGDKYCISLKLLKAIDKLEMPEGEEEVIKVEEENAEGEEN